MSFRSNEAKYRKRTTMAWKLSAACLISIALVLSLALYWLIRPYHDLTIESVNNGHIINATEFTRAGVPVIRRAGAITFNIDVCNKGVSTYTERWMVSPSAGSHSDTLVADSEDAETSFGISPVIFTNNAEFCGVIPVIMFVPVSMETDRIYTLRYVTTYSPNPLREVEVIFESEPFFLAPDPKSED